MLVDDHVVPPRTGRGRQPLLSDSELITLALAQVLLGYHRERRWVRHIRASADWRAMFPHLPKQPGYHKRLKQARPLLCKAIATLAACCPSWFDEAAPRKQAAHEHAGCSHSRGPSEWSSASRARVYHFSAWVLSIAR